MLTSQVRNVSYLQICFKAQLLFLKKNIQRIATVLLNKTNWKISPLRYKKKEYCSLIWIRKMHFSVFFFATSPFRSCWVGGQWLAAPDPHKLILQNNGREFPRPDPITFWYQINCVFFHTPNDSLTLSATWVVAKKDKLNLSECWERSVFNLLEFQYNWWDLEIYYLRAEIWMSVQTLAYPSEFQGSPVCFNQSRLKICLHHIPKLVYMCHVFPARNSGTCSSVTGTLGGGNKC